MCSIIEIINVNVAFRVNMGKNNIETEIVNLVCINILCVQFANAPPRGSSTTT